MYNFVRKINIASAIVVIVIAGVVAGCQQEDFGFFEPYGSSSLKSDESISTIDNVIEKTFIDKNDWEKQLQYLVNNDNSFMTNNRLKLLGYNLVDVVDSKEKSDIVKRELLREDNYIPLYDNIPNSIILSLVNNIPVKYKNQFTPEGLKDYISKVDFSNTKKIELQWKYKDVIFSSICLVSDVEGIIYDNILTNIIIFELKDSMQSPNTSEATPRLKSGSEQATLNGPIEYQRRYGGNAYWLWGSERGDATISISCAGVAVNGVKSITSHSEWTTDYITIGKSNSQVKLNSFSTGNSGHYDVAWGWYLATPVVSISLEFAGGSYSVNVGFSLGSETHGIGREYVDPSKLN